MPAGRFGITQWMRLAGGRMVWGFHRRGTWSRSRIRRSVSPDCMRLVQINVTVFTSPNVVPERLVVRTRSSTVAPAAAATVIVCPAGWSVMAWPKSPATPAICHCPIGVLECAPHWG